VSPSFEFCFVSVVSSRADSQGENATIDEDLKKVQDLGKDGWQISGISPDPQHPAARLMVSLQRQTQG